jgi:sarcosine oxidase/L-pipecolate oxidase
MLISTGHAFKFGPIIGREILKVIERKPSPQYADRWSFSPTEDVGADTRIGVRRILKLDELATHEDLKRDKIEGIRGQGVTCM